MREKPVYGQLEGIEAKVKIMRKISEMKMRAKLYEYVLESKHTINISWYGQEQKELSIYDVYGGRFYMENNYIEEEDCFQFYMMDRRLYPSIKTKLNSFLLIDEAIDILLKCYTDIFRKIEEFRKEKKADRILLLRSKTKDIADNERVYLLIDEINGEIKSERPVEFLIKGKYKIEILTMIFDSKNNTFEFDSIREAEYFNEENYWTEIII